MSELEHREFQVRLAQPDDAQAEERTFVGIAVPWGQVANIAGIYDEVIERGAVVESDDAKVFWQHREPIGKITEHRDVEEGWEITGTLSRTPRGDEAYTLLKDGVLDRLSIGFEPIEHRDHTREDGSISRTRTKVRVREVSVVTFPAYEGAGVTQVRETANKEETPMSDTLTRADLDEVRTSIEDMDRELKLIGAQATAPRTQDRQDRYGSVGELLKRMAAGDERAIRDYAEAFEARAWEGSTSADTILRDGWVGSLVEVIKRRRPVISTFATGALPAEGMTVEYGVLESDATQVDVQDDEGDDLAYGKVAIGTRNAPVVTLGGWSSQSRQAIERSSVGVLDVMWEALAEKYGQRSEAYARARLNAAIAATGATALATVEADLTTQDGIVAAVLDLAEHFDNVGRALDGVFVDKATFLALYAVPATDRVLQVSGAPADKVGTITVQTAQGNVAGLEFKLLPNATAGTVVAYDATAMRTLEAPGAPFRLQDGNIVNLTQDFSLYGYLSAYVQKPAGLVKVVEG